MRRFFVCIMLISACYWFAVAVGVFDLSPQQGRLASLILGITIAAEALRTEMA